MFVKLSKEKALSQKIILDSLFITDYLPFAPELCVKVYLFGLSLAFCGAENSADIIAERLGITADDVLAAFKYWEDQGLVSMLSLDPPLIEFKEVSAASKRIRTFSKTKYKAFNDQLHAMFPNRTILPNEYNEYYNTIESFHIESEGMLAIIAYCLRLKGDNIGYPYILTVARNLAAEGYTTFDRINERLSEFDHCETEIKAIIKALNQKRKPDVNDKQYFIKWTKNMGFALETIIKAAKDVKKGGVERLDFLLTRYYENHALTYDEIKAYNDNREKLFSLTAKIVRVLGKYYERLDYIIEAYTQRWLLRGFSSDALVAIADHCFRQGCRDLEGMDVVVDEFYQKGLLDLQSIGDFKKESMGADEVIKKLFRLAGIERAISGWDRDFYRTWTYTWQMPLDVLEYAAGLSKGKSLSYTNGIVAAWQAKGVNTLTAAKAESKKPSEGTSVPDVTTVTKKSVEELKKEFGTVSPEDI